LVLIDFTQFLTAHTPELLHGAAAIIMTFSLTEILKPLIILGLLRLGVPNKFEPSALRSISFVATLLPVLVLDFRGSWESMTGKEIDIASALIVGCLLTWAGTQVAWILVNQLGITRALRAFFYRQLGVEDLLNDDDQTAKNGTGTGTEL